MATFSSFMTRDELEEIGFASLGENILISRKASFYSPENISIGNNVRIDDFCILSGKVSLGNYVHIAAFGAIFGSHGVLVSDYSGISIRTTILSSTDDMSGCFFGNPMLPKELRRVKGEMIELGRLSWVGAHCLLLPGAIVNEGVALGASTVLMRETKAWSVYMGNPAVFVKERSKDILQLEKELAHYEQ